MEKIIKRNKGITLIALIVTIIVLIILAGVAIAMLSGDSGILNRASEAKLATEIAAFKENVSLAQLAVKAHISSRMASEPGYIAATNTNNNMENLAKEVAKDLGLNVAKRLEKEVEIASVEGINGLKIATLVGSGTGINTEGYTVSYTLDTDGANAADGYGNGYITIWYTSNGLRSSIDMGKIESEYKISDTTEGAASRNEATLVSVIHVTNYNSELVSFTSTGTQYGITSTTNGNSDISKTAFSGMSINNKVSVTHQSIVPVESVSLNKSTLSLNVGGTETLTATVLPSNATNKTVTWSTSDSTVVSVSNGALTANKAGTATITATSGGKSASCTVTVANVPQEEDYTFIVDGTSYTGYSTETWAQWITRKGHMVGFTFSSDSSAIHLGGSQVRPLNTYGYSYVGPGHSLTIDSDYGIVTGHGEPE